MNINVFIMKITNKIIFLWTIHFEISLKKLIYYTIIKKLIVYIRNKN